MAPASTVVTSTPARLILGLLRLAVGFVFLWSFLDKTFGLHYSTGPSRAWINGGTPAQSYLTGATTGKPLASTGASGVEGTLVAGFIAVAAGAGTVVYTRRRKKA